MRRSARAAISIPPVFQLGWRAFRSPPIRLIDAGLAGTAVLSSFL